MYMQLIHINTQRKHTMISQGYSYSFWWRKVNNVLPKPVQGRWFDPSWCHWYKILLISLCPWGRLSLQRKWVHGAFPGGKGGQCVRLTTLPPSYAVVMKSGSLNFLEPSGPLQACNGTALPLPKPVHLPSWWWTVGTWWRPKLAEVWENYETDRSSERFFQIDLPPWKGDRTHAAQRFAISLHTIVLHNEKYVHKQVYVLGIGITQSVQTLGYGLDYQGVWFDYRQGRVFLFSEMSRRVLWPTHPPTQWIPWTPSPGVNRSAREADHNLQTSSDIKNECSHTPTLLRFFQCCPQGPIYLYRILYLIAKSLDLFTVFILFIYLFINIQSLTM